MNFRAPAVLANAARAVGRVNPSASRLVARTLATLPQQNILPTTSTSNYPKKHSPDVPPNSLIRPEIHPRTHNIPVALLHFRSHSTERLNFFLHFALHAAYAFGIPVSRPAFLPTHRSLYTVPKSPFVHKSAQENFEKNVHKRAVKVWDTNPVVLQQWLKYLEHHMMAGIGMRVTKWERVEFGFGDRIEAELDEEIRQTSQSYQQEIQEIAENIIKKELEASSKASLKKAFT
ncbi:mitochondrial 37S ribosomal protein rsm10 [Tulasnella sp. 419]|nr:mitochondrial 37S ribosomal protein rsm10 [Tulasnella sp. 419]